MEKEKRREAIRNKLREKSEYKMKSENVAIPEIHTKDFDEIEEHIDEIEQEKEEKHSILYDNVAIPEVHIHKKKKIEFRYAGFQQKWQYILPVLVNVLPVCYYASALIFAYNCFLTK